MWSYVAIGTIGVLVIIVVLLVRRLIQQDGELTRERAKHDELDRVVKEIIPVMSKFARRLLHALHPTLQHLYVWCEPAIDQQADHYSSSDRKKIRRLDGIWKSLDSIGFKFQGFAHPRSMKLQDITDQYPDPADMPKIGEKALLYHITFEDDKPKSLDVALYTYTGSDSDGPWRPEDFIVQAPLYVTDEEDAYYYHACDLYRQIVDRAYGTGKPARV